MSTLTFTHLPPPEYGCPSTCNCDNGLSRQCKKASLTHGESIAVDMIVEYMVVEQ